MPCDHFAILVPPSKLEDVINFLTTSMSHLGFKELMRPDPVVAGLGETMPYLWIAGYLPEGVDEKTFEPMLRQNHAAFKAKGRSIRIPLPEEVCIFRLR